MKRLSTDELRQAYLDFFAKNGHAVIPGAPLVPENDPTVLFTTAGMHPLVPYLMGETHPKGTRLTDAQRCIRTGDIDEVGDASHLTLFEMMGNWSLGDYFKEGAIQMSFDFLTKVLEIPVEKLAVTCFDGDRRFPDLPRDNESAEIWKKVGMPEERIGFLEGGVVESKKNWWGPAGMTGPCGPDTEMFYWVGEGEPTGNPATHDAQWMEIWNDVFMQYNKKEDGTFVPLAKQNVDTGMGLERVAAVLQGVSNVYETDRMKPIMEKISTLSAPILGRSATTERHQRIITDHLKASVFMIADGVTPGNVDQAYILRRIIRRAIRSARALGIEASGGFTPVIAEEVIAQYGHIYGALKDKEKSILDALSHEEQQFGKTLQEGMKQFAKIMFKTNFMCPACHRPSPSFFQFESPEIFETFTVKNFDYQCVHCKQTTSLQKSHLTFSVTEKIDGLTAFHLYDTYGFPLELTKEMAAEYGAEVDEQGFNTAFAAHQSLSRAGAEQKFKGGLADNSAETTKLHTATHLLNAALHRVLGNHVMQKGSNITAERLRFDFNHGDKMTSDQIKLVEDLVNEAIKADLPVSYHMSTVDGAKEEGAIGVFDDRYGSDVKVYVMGDPAGMTAGSGKAGDGPVFSKEICGGPHVARTGMLGHFTIQKEESSSAGVRRIKAVVSGGPEEIETAGER